MQTVKSMLHKGGCSSDIYAALLALISKFSVIVVQTESRTITSGSPQSAQLLQPQWPDLNKFRQMDEVEKGKVKSHYDLRHRAREVPALSSGCHISVLQGGSRVPGVIQCCDDAPRSYSVNIG